MSAKWQPLQAFVQLAAAKARANTTESYFQLTILCGCGLYHTACMCRLIIILRADLPVQQWCQLSYMSRLASPRYQPVWTRCWHLQICRQLCQSLGRSCHPCCLDMKSPIQSVKKAR